VGRFLFRPAIEVSLGVETLRRSAKPARLASAAALYSAGGQSDTSPT